MGHSQDALTGCEHPSSGLLLRPTSLFAYTALLSLNLLGSTYLDITHMVSYPTEPLLPSQQRP